MLWVYLTVGAFTVWMLVDAYHRQPEPYWFWIILLIPLAGPVAYFAAYKLDELRLPKHWSLFRRGPSLTELRFRAEQTPTLANHVALAERLMDHGQFAEAVPHLETALTREPEYCHALYRLAVCHSKLGQLDQAVPYLEKILRIDRYYSNYAAWNQLILFRAEQGNHDAAVETCRELVRLAPTLQHHCLLAERLLDAGQTGEAQKVLSASLETYHYQAPSIRWRNRRWASLARRLQRHAAGR